MNRRGQYLAIGIVLVTVAVIGMLWLASTAKASEPIAPSTSAGQPMTAHTRVVWAMNQIAGRHLILNCGYAGVGAEALAFPEGGPDTGNVPEVLSKWMWCQQAEDFVVSPDVADAKALLILTHESEHIHVWDGYRDEARVECRALVEIGRFATMLGAPPSMLPALNAAALQADIGSHVPSCRDMKS